MVSVTPPHGAWRHFSPMASRISCGGVPLGMSVASLTRTGASAPSKVIAGEARLTSPSATTSAHGVLRVDLPDRLIVFVSLSFTLIVSSRRVWARRGVRSLYKQLVAPSQKPARPALHHHVLKPPLGLGVGIDRQSALE